jgi:hypothetical protein
MQLRAGDAVSGAELVDGSYATESGFHLADIAGVPDVAADLIRNQISTPSMLDRRPYVVFVR